jgi:hypothetical protein
MGWIVAVIVAFSGWIAQSGAKALFYDAGGHGAPEAAQAPGLRPITIAPHEVNGGGRLPVGMHFWLETDRGTPISQRAASTVPGKYTLHLRHNNQTSAVLSIWQVNGDGRELTPRTYERWSGYAVQRDYRVPGTFEFAEGASAPHIIIVLARSQTEVPRDAAHARLRLVEIPRFFNNITEVDQSTAGEIGTYVVSRTGGPTAAEVILRSSR